MHDDPYGEGEVLSRTSWRKTLVVTVIYESPMNVVVTNCLCRFPRFLTSSPSTSGVRIRVGCTRKKREIHPKNTRKDR